eukprot:3575116-Rhodomonas_salina.1
MRWCGGVQELIEAAKATMLGGADDDSDSSTDDGERARLFCFVLYLFCFAHFCLRVESERCCRVEERTRECVRRSVESERARDKHSILKQRPSDYRPLFNRECESWVGNCPRAVAMLAQTCQCLLQHVTVCTFITRALREAVNVRVERGAKRESTRERRRKKEERD